MCGQPTLPLDFGSSRPRYWFLLRRSILRSHLSHCQINMDMAFMASQHFRFHLRASQIQICCHIWQVWHARKVQPSGQLAIIRFCFLTKAKYPLTGNIHIFLYYPKFSVQVQVFISFACKKNLEEFLFILLLLLFDEYQSMQFPTATKKSIRRIRWKLDKWKISLSNVKTLDGLPLKIEKNWNKWLRREMWCNF